MASPTVTSCSVADCGSMSTPLIELIRGIAVDDPDMDAVHPGAGHRSVEKLAADCQQNRVREDRVDHPAAALRLHAAAHDQLQRRIVVGERDLAMLGHALAREVTARRPRTERNHLAA